MLTIKENADNQKKESFKCKALPWQFSNSTEVSYPISYLTTTDSNSIAWDLCSTASPKCSHQSWISRNKYTRDVMNLTEKNELTQVIQNHRLKLSPTIMWKTCSIFSALGIWVSNNVKVFAQNLNSATLSQDLGHTFRNMCWMIKTYAKFKHMIWYAIHFII